MALSPSSWLCHYQFKCKVSFSWKNPQMPLVLRGCDERIPQISAGKVLHLLWLFQTSILYESSLPRKLESQYRTTGDQLTGAPDPTWYTYITPTPRLPRANTTPYTQGSVNTREEIVVKARGLRYLLLVAWRGSCSHGVTICCLSKHMHNDKTSWPWWGNFTRFCP